MSDIEERRKKRMDDIDDLPVPIRRLVNDYGYNVVRALMDCGVKKPNRIKHIVETVLDEFSPTRGSYSCQRNAANVPVASNQLHPQR